LVVHTVTSVFEHVCSSNSRDGDHPGTRNLLTGRKEEGIDAPL